MFGCIIQARMGSNRLPGKVMKFLDEKNPSLYYTISQIKNVKNIKRIVIATTKLDEDDVIYDFTKKMNVGCFRGSADDVLDRYYQCAKQNKLDKIIRITADCPLIDPQLVDNIIEDFNKNEFDYVQNLEPRTFPDGMDVEIFTFNSLEKAWQDAVLPSEREHVTSYFRNNENKFRIKNIVSKKDLSHFRLTLDYNEDLKLLRTIIKKISKRPILISDILSLFLEEPSLIEINKNHVADEGYKLSLEKDKEFLKKSY